MRKDRGNRLPLFDRVPESGEPFAHEVRARDLWKVADLHQQPNALVDRSDDRRNVMGNVLPFFGWDPRERFQGRPQPRDRRFPIHVAGSRPGRTEMDPVRLPRSALPAWQRRS